MTESQTVTFVDHTANNELIKRYEALLAEGQSKPNQITDIANELRQLVLIHGLPQETTNEKKIMSHHVNVKGFRSTLRGRIWKAFLRVDVVDSNFYMHLVEKGPESAITYGNILSDTGRTFKSDQDFTSRVSEDMLKRVLNSFLINYGGDSSDFSFLQGMSLISGVFLYVMNEVDAFYSFQRFITRVCPAYFKAGEMAGVHAGCELIDEILATVDPELAKTLPEGRQWAFECVCALSLNSQPLTEALHLYDFFIAFGLHYSIIFTVAQALIIRDELMKGGNLQKKLKDMSLSIDAKKIISVGCHIVGMIGEETYRKLVRNSVDIDVARSIVVVANERRKKTKSETDRQLSPIINHNQRNFTSPIMKEAQKINRSRTKQK